MQRIEEEMAKLDNMKIQVKEEVSPEVTRIFAMFDVNGDGFVSKQELKDGIVRDGFPFELNHHLQGANNEEKCDALFTYCDANVDGKLSFDELVGGINRCLDEMFEAIKEKTRRQMSA